MEALSVMKVELVSNVVKGLKKIEKKKNNKRQSMTACGYCFTIVGICSKNTLSWVFSISQSSG